MKTKLSKRILSVVLAALMVVTSIPLMAMPAFADVSSSDVSSSDLNVSALDSYAKELYDEMTAFEDKLQEDVYYSDIATAYSKYVAAQKIFDAYVYGSGTVSSANVEAAAAALRNASDAMPVFTGKATGNAIPTFPAYDSGKTAEESMAEYKGTGFNNVLKASTAEKVLEAGQVGGIMHNVYYAPDATLLYDGSGDAIILPVLMAAYAQASKEGYDGSNKGRWIWSAYPSQNASSTSDSADFYLDTRWQSSYTDGSTTGPGNDANWNYNWWAGQWANGTGNTSKAEYNFTTGAAGTIKNTMSGYVTSGRIPRTNRKLSGVSYKYSQAGTIYMANALKYKGTPADWGQQYNVSWVVTTGGSDNSDGTNTVASTPISVINFKTYADKYKEAYAYIKGIELADYSEGGLADYFAAYKNAAAYDPNSSFGADGGYDKCIADMKALVVTNTDGTALPDWNDNVTNGWGVTANNADYAELRSAMNLRMADYNNGVNNGATAESWDAFIAAWAQGQSVMNDVASNGYQNAGRARTAAAAIKAATLVSNTVKVNTVFLEAVINEYSSWARLFTDETAGALTELITEIKTTVWTPDENGNDRYGSEVAKVDDGVGTRNMVESYEFQLVSAIKALRINPEAIVATGIGRYSVNSAMAREAEVVDRKSELSGYAEFQTALNQAQTYKNSLGDVSIDFTVEKVYDKITKEVTSVKITSNYTEKYDEYVAVTRNVVEKREALAPALTSIKDGEVMKTVGTSTISLEEHRNSNGYNFYANYTIPRSTIIFKTTHNDAKYTYGQGTLEWKVNLNNNTNIGESALDSITIDAKRVSGQLKQKYWAVGQNGYPEALDPDQKTELNDALSYTVTNADNTQSTFELENFRFAKKYNGKLIDTYAYDANGNAMQDKTADFTSIFATTEGGNGSRTKIGVIPLAAMNSGDAAVTFTNDMTVTVPGREKQPLSADTRPEVKYINMTGNYFGATFQYRIQPTGGQYNGWQHMSTVPNGDYAGQEMYSSVMVIDIAYLLDLIKECNAIAFNSENYTPESWSTFAAALKEANTAITYTENTSADAVRKTVQNRYDALWAAYKALEIPLTFVGKNADGTDNIKTVNVLRQYYLNDALNASEYGATTDYLAQLETATATAQTYFSEDLTKRYDLAGWSPETDLDAKVISKTTFTAQYTESPNLADFTKYDEAKDALKAALSTAEPYYSADALNAVKTDTDAMNYFAMTAEQKGGVFAPEQKAIDAETAAVTALTAGLAPAEVSAEDAQIYVAAKKSVLDMDVYNVNAINPEYTVAVTIDGVEYEGLAFDTYAKLDKIVADVLNSATKNVYEIKMNGTVVGTAEYGETVVVDSEGTLHKNVDIDTSYDSLANVAWTYSYAAPSRGAENFTAPKYMLTATSLGFVVKGNTNLTTAGGSAEEKGYTVKFATNDGRVFDVQYTTTGKAVMPVAPNYAFYTFTGYDNGKQARQEITVTENTVVTANYEPLATDTFAITYYNSLSNLYDAVAEIDGVGYAYNTPVELTGSNVYCWVAEIPILDDAGEIVGDEFRVIGGGSDTYKFYACQDITVVALTEAEYREIVDDGQAEILYDNDGNIVQKTRDELTGITTYPAPPAMVYAVEDTFEIYNGLGSPEKFSIVGSVAVPQDAKLIESGFLVSTNKAANLKVENVGKDGVNRFKTSRIIGDNQFVINIKSTSNISFKYVAYAIIQMPDGSLNTIYTNAIDGQTNFN